MGDASPRSRTPNVATRDLYGVIRSRPDGKELIVAHPADVVSRVELNFRISAESIRWTFATTPKRQG
jgi:hypothetical protein